MINGTRIRNEPAYRQRPAAIPNYHAYREGSFVAFISETALQAIAAETMRCVPNEAIGFLIGRPFRDALGVYTVVTTALVATGARRSPGTVETSIDDEVNATQAVLHTYPVCEKVGWWHSHPFSLPTYSRVDEENQRLWTEPFHLGLLACVERSLGELHVHAFQGPNCVRLLPIVQVRALQPPALQTHIQVKSVPSPGARPSQIQRRRSISLAVPRSLRRSWALLTHSSSRKRSVGGVLPDRVPTASADSQNTARVELRSAIESMKQLESSLVALRHHLENAGARRDS